MTLRYAREQRSGEARPRVVVVTGQHGDEPMGPVLAQVLQKKWQLFSKVDVEFDLITFGLVNPYGFAHGERELENGDDRNRVWNRNKPYDDLGREVWTLLDTSISTLLLDLHSTTAVPFVYAECVEDSAIARRLFRHMYVEMSPCAGSLIAEASDIDGLLAFTIEVSRREPLGYLPNVLWRGMTKWARQVIPDAD